MLKSNSDLENPHYTPLYSFAEIVMGQSPDSKFVNDEQFGSPFLQGNGEFTTKYPKPIHWVTHPGKMAKKGDILISVRAPVGEINIADQDYCIGRGLAAIRFKNRIDPDYGWYAISFYKGQINRFAQGSTFLAVNSNDIRSIEIPMLEESEQLKIAKVLTTVDDAIEQTETLIRKYQRIKQGLMQDLLTRGVDENGELRNANLLAKTSIGNFPQHWNITTLGDIHAKYGGVIQTGPFGSQLHSFEYVQEGIPVIMPQDIVDNGMINVQNIARISGKKASELSRHVVQANDVVFARRGDLSRCSAIKDREVGWLCGTGCMLVRFSPKIIDSGWLAAIYRHDIGQRQIQARAVGSTMVNLNSQLLKELFVPLPDIKEQKAIMQILEAQERLISLERSNLVKMNLIKHGLMQDLLTGKVRVNVLQKN